MIHKDINNSTLEFPSFLVTQTGPADTQACDFHAPPWLEMAHVCPTRPLI